MVLFESPQSLPQSQPQIKQRQKLHRHRSKKRQNLLKGHSILSINLDFVSQVCVAENELPPGLVNRRVERRQSAVTEQGPKKTPGRRAQSMFIRSGSIATKDDHLRKSDLGIDRKALLLEEKEIKDGIRNASDISDEFSDDDDGSSSPASVGVLATIFVGIVLGGIGANVALEQINALHPGCGSVITLLQYIVAVAEKAPNAKHYALRPTIPLPLHVLFCALLFAASQMGNRCLEYNLPFSLYLVIKNSNLVFSMIAGALMLKKTYSVGQIASVVIVSVGVIVSIFASQDGDAGGNTDEGKEDGQDSGISSDIFVGIILCISSTLAMACLGTTQEYTFNKYKLPDGGAPISEAMFYTHVFGLPFFFNGGLFGHVASLATQWKVALPLILLNVGSMVVCKSNIFKMMEISSSLTTTLAITFSRFSGIIISVCILSSSTSSPGWDFWLGASCVVGGSVMYLFSGSKQPQKKQEVSQKKTN